MRYLALLRGINVGGKNKVSMARLKEAFEDAGHGEVRTYINSGNVIFTAPRTPAAVLGEDLERQITKTFDLDVRVLVLPGSKVSKIASDLPQRWIDGPEMRCYVMFLWPEHASATIVDRFEVDPAHEEIRYSHGALLWRVDRSHLTRSAMAKMVGTDLYKNMTIRNSNTLRKLQGMLSEA